MFPGIDITKLHPDWIEGIESRSNPLDLDPFAALCLSNRVDHGVFDTNFFHSHDRFLLYYERHNRPEDNRLFLVDRDSLISFLTERIRPDRGQGLDLTITTQEMEQFLICSHDGDMFFRVPSEWPDKLKSIGEANDSADDQEVAQ